MNELSPTISNVYRFYSLLWVNKDKFKNAVKQEPGEETENENEEKQKDFLHTGQASSEPESFEDSVAYLLSKLQSDVMFFQLPSCLPSHPPENMETNSSTSTQSQVAGKDSSKDPVCTLDTLPDGKIGSLKVYESGRVDLCLGNYNMELNHGTPVGFLQDVVRMEVDSEQKTGSMVVLGHIKDRLVCTPDFHSLTNTLGTS